MTSYTDPATGKTVEVNDVWTLADRLYAVVDSGETVRIKRESDGFTSSMRIEHFTPYWRLVSRGGNEVTK